MTAANCEVTEITLRSERTGTVVPMTGVAMTAGTYCTPELRNCGSLVDLTAAQGLFGTGGSKLVPLHHVPVPAPSAPAGR